MCHSFSYLFSNPLSALSLVSFGSQRTTCLGLPCYLASGNFWPRGGTDRMPETDEEKPGFLSLSCLPWAPSLAESCSFAINSHPLLLCSQVLGLTLTKWHAFWILETLSFQPQGQWFSCYCQSLITSPFLS